MVSRGPLTIARPQGSAVSNVGGSRRSALRTRAGVPLAVVTSTTPHAPADPLTPHLEEHAEVGADAPAGWQQRGFSTRAIHAGSDPDAATGAS